MGAVYFDATHENLVWLEFDGPTWDSYHILLDEFVKLIREHPTPSCMIFVPAVDMPKGSPMPHIQRMMTLMEREPNFEMMIAVVPAWMRVAAMFAKMMMRVFRHKMPEEQTIAKDREEALAIYQRYQAKKAEPQP